MARVREWFHRYAVAEVTGLVCALVAATAAGRAAGPAAAAVAGTLGEGVGFYGVMLVREIRRHGRHWRVVRGLLVEFGVAELADTLAVRPVAIYAATLLTGDTAAGVLIGKVAADVVFYAIAIAGYEFHKRWAARSPGPAAGAPWPLTGSGYRWPVAGPDGAWPATGSGYAWPLARPDDVWPVFGSAPTGTVYGRAAVTTPA